MSRPHYYIRNPNDKWDVLTPGGLEKAQAWFKEMVEDKRDGTMFAIPRSFAIYTLNPSTKTIIRELSARDEAMEFVVKSLGWTLTTQE
jgi:hypothetical protein